jgi:hypothetical protein
MSKDDSQNSSIAKAQAASKAEDHDKFARIRNLPEEQYKLVVAMLKAHSPYMIAKTIQQDWQQCLDVTQLTLAHQLDRFRAATIPLEQLINPYVIAKITEQVRRNVNVISEMSSLIDLQQERLRQVRLLELEGGALLPSVDKQTAILARLLKNYGDIAYKTGLVNHFVADFRKLVESEEEEHMFSLRKLYFNQFRSMFLEDPSTFQERMLALLFHF